MQAIVSTLAIILLGQVLIAPAFANPLPHEEQLFHSHNGISSYSTTTLNLQWQLHPDKQTFEPVITDDRLLIASSDQLYCHQQHSGELLWTYQGNSPLFSPSIRDGVVYIGSEKGDVIALSLNDGHTLWQQKLKGWSYPPAISNELVLTGGSSGLLTALNKHTGKVVWQYDAGQEFVYKPHLHKQQVVFTTFNGNAIAVDLNGHLLWRQPLGAVSMTPVSSLDQNHLYFAGIEGTITTLNSTHGDVIWQQKTAAPVNAAITLFKQWLFVNNQNGELIKIDRHTGHISTRKQTRLSLIGSPHPQSEDQIIVFHKTLNSDQPLLIDLVAANY